MANEWNQAERGFTPASPEDRKVISDLMRECEEYNGMAEVDSLTRQQQRSQQS